MTPRKPRDPRHHVCVDRQTYRGMALFVVGWLVAGFLDWIGAPVWLSFLVLVLALIAIPIVELAADSDERRRAAAADQAADPW